MKSAEDQLDAWIKRIAPRAVAYARTLLDRPGRAEEVVQGVFLRLLEHSEYDLLNDGEKLLFRSITNACINQTTRREELRSLHAEAEDGWSLMAALESPDSPDPVETALSEELLSAVRAGLAELPPMQRAAVELKATGSSLKQIAETLEVSPSNAGVLVHRGRKRLKAKLGAQLPGELR